MPGKLPPISSGPHPDPLPEYQEREQEAKPRPRRRWIRGLVAAVVMGSGYWTFVRYITFNFHTVLDGQVFRSCQMSPSGFGKTIREHGIKSVLKLNGVKESGWSQAEQAAVESAGAAFVYVKMPVGRLPRRQEMVDLLAAIESAPRPMLIHCKSGADRTGVAAALIRMQAGESFQRAVDEELRLAYLHVGHFGDDIADIFDEYRLYKKQRNEDVGGWAEFTQYIRDVYAVKRD